MQFRNFYSALSLTYGEPALKVRSEIFFQQVGRGKMLQALRGIAALLRDLVYLLRLPSRGYAGGAHLAVVTLPGANGWGTLERAVRKAQEAGFAVKTVKHPRLGRSEARLCRPGARTVIEAVRAAAALPSARMPGVSHLLVACCVLRHHLWKNAWERLLDSGCLSLLLHNDFDLVSQAAVAAARGKVATVCLQHGIPTDEFFPATADYYVVWGKSSKSVFARSGIAAERLIEEGFGRGRSSGQNEPPETICVVSQSHTPVYGIDLRDRFTTLAAELERGCQGIRVKVLLHPEEARRGAPYAFLGPRVEVHSPPHPELAGQGPAALVLGFSSTALIDAALAGHFVVGIDWVPASSAWAKEIVSPPASVSTCAQLFDLYRELAASVESRRRFLERQEAWLAQVFAPTDGGEFCSMLRGLHAP